MLNINIELQTGIGVIVETCDDSSYNTAVPMQLISMDGIRVAYKRVDIDNLTGGVTFGRVLPVVELYSDGSTTELVYFKETNQHEFYKHIEAFITNRFQTVRDRFIKSTVPTYTENSMLLALDRCLLAFDSARYYKEHAAYDSENKAFF